ncbi:MAG: extracellular solute-binding protein [Lachnospiraceae bacterium]|nr:extracellular solute-binding protein [Lachnospiraceae bacterium]
MKDSLKKIMLIGGIAAVIAVALIVNNLTRVEDFHDKYEGTDLTVDAIGAVREGTYTKYLEAHADAALPQKDVEVDLLNYVSGEDVEAYKEKAGALYTASGSTVTWEISVPESGFYNVFMEYLTVESRGVAVERAFYINGELPFDDAGTMTFSRIWTNDGDVRVDNQGNEIRPPQVEVFDWQSSYFKDDMGYIVEPYRFYFEKGKNEITLEAVNEPAVIGSLTIKGIEDKLYYKDYLAQQPGVNASEKGLKHLEIVQGEDSTIRSESSLYAKYDRSSASTQPNSVTTTVLNYAGGEAWRDSGQWIEWNVTVPEDGFYNITVKARQNYQRGAVSSRILYIDGKTPFEEVKEISFDYANEWECKTLSDENGEPYKFYLTEGTHTLRLEATMGDMGMVLEELEDSVFRLNQIYRQTLVYIGANPDKYRDYNLEQIYPEIIEAMDLESKRLYKIVDDTVALTGQKGDKIATAQTLADQLERFVDRPDKISVEFVNFKDNITSLGTAMLSMSQTKLDVDYLVVSGVEAEVEKDEAGTLAAIWHELKSFGASFVVDYDAVGDVYDDLDSDDVIKVWVLSGRDQGTILKSMIDDTFTPDTGVKVNVEIVAADALLNAVVAGRGPNVVLTVGADQPVNYALRNAVEDLTQFEDLDEVLDSYTESSYRQYSLDGSVYALPETMTFNVMFYREDILEQLGLEPPQTWQELVEMLPTIQGNNMSIGIPSAAGSSGSAAASTTIASNTPDLSMYFSMLYQNGGDLYNEAGTETTVDSEAGVEAFSDYVAYFNDYGIPTYFDFISRFRSGEMPIGIASYSTYNTLMVSAPEIKGLWDFTLIPGTEKTDENGNTYIDRSDFITGSATMMIRTEDETLRNNSWEFMKWWASPDTQIRFGREIEALLGSSARYATANIDAFTNLAWSADDIEVLMEQWQWTVGIREVPGGYYTGRHITNAIRKVINDKDDPRETIQDYTITIDEEITKKRIEFGLPLE